MAGSYGTNQRGSEGLTKVGEVSRSKRRESGTTRGYGGMPAQWKVVGGKGVQPQSKPSFYPKKLTKVTQDNKTCVTQSMLKDHYRTRDRPGPSFDLDGDGIVSQRDYYLASNFDDNRDRKLNERELSNARAGTVLSPHGELKFKGSVTDYSYQAREQGRTRTQLLQERKEVNMQENQRVHTAFEARTSAAHKDLKDTLGQAHPWARSQGRAWGPDVVLDKISAVHGTSSSTRPHSTPAAFTQARDVESGTYGQAQLGQTGTLDMADWKQRTKLHKNPIPSKRDQVLFKASYGARPATYGETYNNVVSGSSQKDRSQQTFGYAPRVPLSSGQAKFQMITGNNDRTKKPL